jgi:hypothetical protein
MVRVQNIVANDGLQVVELLVGRTAGRTAWPRRGSVCELTSKALRSWGIFKVAVWAEGRIRD